MIRDFNYTLRDNVLIIQLNKDLDHHIAENIREKIDELIDDNDVKHLIIDFSNVSFMDSSGIGVIMGRYKKIRYADGNIAVIGINKMIDRIFNMSALYRITLKCDDLQTALKELNEI